MMRPVAGAVSRGLHRRRYSAALGLAPRLAADRMVPAAALRPLTCALYPSVAARQNKTDDGRMRWAALAAGTGLALWSSSPDEKPPASCSSSQTMEEPPAPVGVVPFLSKPPPAAASAVSLNNNSSTTSSSSSSKRGHERGQQQTGGSLSRQTQSSVSLVVSSTYNGNGPIEDRHDIRQSPRGDFFAGVYDGHGGWQAAELARKRLNIAAQTELKNTLADNAEQVKGALTQAFLRVEREYLYQVKTAFDLGFGAVARTGACAIMALVRDNRLFVANAGDCRAVLGRRRRKKAGWGGSGGGDGITEAVALSNDHNAKEESEQAKLRRLHPFEGDVFTCKRAGSCYVKGRLQPTRSFGDAYLKYPEFNGQEDTHRSAGRFLPPPYTPPYITAEPEISVHEIDEAQDDFVVLASDGLWDHVTNAEAVEIVRNAAYVDGEPEAAGDRLIMRVLERAAENHGLSVEELQRVPEGSTRRSMHDDITCVVFFLKGNRHNDGFGALQGSKVQGAAARESGSGAAPAQ